MNALLTLVGLALAAGGVPLVFFTGRRLDWFPPRYSASRLRVGLAVQWAVAALVVCFVLFVERRPLSSVGLHAPVAARLGPLQVGGWFGGLFYGFVLVAVAGIVAGYACRLRGIDAYDEATVVLLDQSAGWKLLFSLTAGVTEELLFRGYLIERTVDLTGSVAVAGALSVVAFTAMHLPGRSTRRIAPGVFAVALSLTATYLLVRSLFVLMIVHTAYDFVASLSSGPTEVFEQADDATFSDEFRSRFTEE